MVGVLKVKGWQRPSRVKELLVKSSWFVFLFFFLLSPYVSINSHFFHGGAVSVILLLTVSLRYFRIALLNKEFISLVGLFVILISINIGKYVTTGVVLENVFPVLVVRALFYVICGEVLALFFLRNGSRTNFSDAIKLVGALLVIVILSNSVVILLEYFSPVFKSHIESILYYDESMNINYREHPFRMRGFASAGGAALSVMHAIGAVTAVWLFLREEMGIVRLLGVFSVIAFSMLVIGRTGLVILPVGVSVVVLGMGIRRLSFIRLRAVFLAFAGVIGLAAIPVLAGVWFPRDIYEYSLGFLYRGTEGLVQDGTVSTVASFFHLPSNLMDLVFGAGNFTGSFVDGAATDSGYMKSFTSLGFFGLAILYFGVLFMLLKNLQRAGSAWGDKILVFAIVLIILISEIKEPFLLQGYSARLFWLIWGICAIYASICPARLIKFQKAHDDLLETRSARH